MNTRVEKRSQLFLRAIFILPRYPGEPPPAPDSYFYLRSWNQSAVSQGWMAGCRDNSDSSIRTSLRLTASKAASCPLSDGILLPVWEASIVNGECKPPKEQIGKLRLG